MMARYVEHTQDPTTGEPLTFAADTENELDRKVAGYFGEDRPSGSSPGDASESSAAGDSAGGRSARQPDDPGQNPTPERSPRVINTSRATVRYDLYVEFPDAPSAVVEHIDALADRICASAGHTFEDTYLDIEIVCE